MDMELYFNAWEDSWEDLFRVSDILETTLLSLDMATLLVSANRVSRLWNETISTSSRLQMKLFFLPDFSNQDRMYTTG
jgi:hypothetical protein